ncbi:MULTISPECIES: hypothetical protein [Maribacter]|uniref:Uncharacterized protein n=1 Tax=Maribacter flavus TaxID=1658664 RepID=A0ABU7ILU9_9FLAO|nr:MULTISPECIES: hypothetical protein [Maribacter]MDC6406699.1 hypothetical protein [Maribacter sp. PR66]MEE1973859.1 hypothetical protein [Maribacter flavus]
METEKILLRENPKLEITLEEKEFEIFNEEKQSKNVFFYENISTIELIEKKTNWFVTSLSFIVGFLFESISGDLYKDSNKLILNHANDKIEVLLKHCDYEKTKLLVAKIKSKIYKK